MTHSSSWCRVTGTSSIAGRWGTSIVTDSVAGSSAGRMQVCGNSSTAERLRLQGAGLQGALARLAARLPKARESLLGLRVDDREALEVVEAPSPARQRGRVEADLPTVSRGEREPHDGPVGRGIDGTNLHDDGSGPATTQGDVSTGRAQRRDVLGRCQRLSDVLRRDPRRGARLLGSRVGGVPRRVGGRGAVRAPAQQHQGDHQATPRSPGPRAVHRFPSCTE